VPATELNHHVDPKRRRDFMKRLLKDLQALESLIASGRFESGVRRIGAEQEVFLVDQTAHPCPCGVELLKALDDSHYKTELGLFNLEFNVDPLELSGDCFRRIERKMSDLLDSLRAAAIRFGADVVMTGILPTLRMSDLGLNNMTPLPRYFALNDAIRRLRGSAFQFQITGTDELILQHDSVMVEACNTSCQVHLQVSPDEFATMYNAAQALSGPVLSAAVNSPLLFGRRLWQETRIALFQQAVDTRDPGHQLDDRCARVSFGTGWLRDSVLEVFRDDIARFRVVLGASVEEDPVQTLQNAHAPKLKALSLHNSTIYRWNRPCYGANNDTPHLRIENRVLPAGPSIVDEAANAAFWIGAVMGTVSKYGDVARCMDFDTAKSNFFAAARVGLHAQLAWMDGTLRPARELLLQELLPLAKNGLNEAGVDSGDIDRYLGIIEARVESGRTGAQWLLDSLAGMRADRTMAERLAALTAGTLTRQRSNRPVHEWEPVVLSEAGGWQRSFLRVEQYMTTDLCTVHQDEVIDLAASLMDWRRVRHVPVEDDRHRFVGLVSYRALLRYMARDLSRGQGDPVPVSKIMCRNPITVTPSTSTMDAIRLMRREKIGCLPVVLDGRLVGVVTERDFMDVAAELLDAQLRQDGAADVHSEEATESRAKSV